MVEHTPGPWRTTLAYDDPAIVDHDGGIIAMAVMDEDWTREPQEIVANARLLAAAPDLLAALKQLVQEASDLGWDCSHITPAIAKAEGRSE